MVRGVERWRWRRVFDDVEEEIAIGGFCGYGRVGVLGWGMMSR